MKTKPIVPVLVGRGMAGQAIDEALAIVAKNHPELDLEPVRQVRRGEPLENFMSGHADKVLFLANPSGLHAEFIADAAKAGFSAVATDKPICVRPEELPLLKRVSIPVSVFNGYRVLWGTRLIKSMIEAGELGEVFDFESRYWQCSAAFMTLTRAEEKRSWKNDPDLNGPWDVLTDLGPHPIDICLYLMNARPTKTQCWVSYRNSIAAHRDTHVQVIMGFSGGRRGLASMSKTMHGVPTDFEYTVLGTKAAATWRFRSPDEVEYASGNRTTIIRREKPNESSGTPPFHGRGWLEGYVEITYQTLRHVAGLSSTPIPTLEDACTVMDVLLNSQHQIER